MWRKKICVKSCYWIASNTSENRTKFVNAKWWWIKIHRQILLAIMIIIKWMAGQRGSKICLRRRRRRRRRIHWPMEKMPIIMHKNYELSNTRQVWDSNTSTTHIHINYTDFKSNEFYITNEFCFILLHIVLNIVNSQKYINELNFSIVSI